jgi:MYXO-CTERM domain-containing protein
VERFAQASPNRYAIERHFWLRAGIVSVQRECVHLVHSETRTPAGAALLGLAGVFASRRRRA